MLVSKALFKFQFLLNFGSNIFYFTPFVLKSLWRNWYESQFTFYRSEVRTPFGQRIFFLVFSSSFLS